jgi:phage tail-like protein
MTGTDYQMVGFHFNVVFYGFPDTKNGEGSLKNAKAPQKDVKGEALRPEVVPFQSVAGLDVQFETDSWKEGGENRFTHELPGRVKFSSTLTLKRGLIKLGESGITDWCNDAFVNLKIKPVNLSVELLDEEHNVLVKWDVAHVWPKSWKIGELNAERSEVLIETLELNYNRFTYKKP